MIEVVLASVLFSTPLAMSGNELGLWFVHDIDPSATSYTRSQDIDYELCERISENEFMVVYPLIRRPIGLAVEKQTMWFIDDAHGVGLYSVTLASSMRGSTSRNAMLRSPVMQGVFETTEHPTDFLLYQSSPLLVFGGGNKNETTLVHYVAKEWELLSSVDGSDALVTPFYDELLSAVQGKNGQVTISALRNGAWEAMSFFDNRTKTDSVFMNDTRLLLDGSLVDFLRKDDWPILVTTKNEVATLLGLQMHGVVELASFSIPKGRWGVTSSSGGFVVIGVERNGTTTVRDISWPSGDLSEPIILAERFPDNDRTLMTVLFVSMVLVSLLLLSKIRRTR
jgi:hypothetical protein